MKRRHFSRAAVCSVSGNQGSYEASRKSHLLYLEEKHQHFCNMVVSGELSMDIPTISEGTIQPKFKTIKVFGKEMRVTIEEYNTHCLGL